MASTRSKLDEIVAYFATLEDPRFHINRRHPLPSILVIAVLAVLAGAAGPTAIARWAVLKEDFRMGLLDLPRGIPGKDVFRRVLMMLKLEAFEAAFNAWIARLRDEAVAQTGVDRPIIAIDGKSARRRHDAKEDPGPLARRHRLGRRVRPGPGAGGLCREVQRAHGDPRAATEDRRPGQGGDDRRDGAQKAIAEEVIPGRADYVLALKGNHESLHMAVIEHIDERLAGELGAGSRRVPLRSVPAADAPWPAQCTGIAVNHKAGPISHAPPRSRHGPRAGGGTRRSPAAGRPSVPRAARDAAIRLGSDLT